MTQADNGEDAMVLVDEEDPDIIILDWMMPKVSGHRGLSASEDAAGHAGAFRSSCCRPGPKRWTGSGGWKPGRTTM